MANSKTIVRSVCDNIGQVKKDQAEAEIARLNAKGNKKWKADNSHFLFCPDETDERCNNPCKLSEGYVWIVTE